MGKTRKKQSRRIDVVKPKSVGMSRERLRRVSRWLENQVTSERVAGASALIARHGQVAFFETTGMADVEAGKPFAEDTIVRMYSMTKPITAVAAMMLYEEGCFALDDPVARYLPEFAETRVWAGGGASAEQTVLMATPMTVRHLMTHTSGLTYGFMRSNPVDALYRKRHIDFHGGAANLAEVVERVAKIPLICQPGSAWNYSVSSDVLGRLVEVWSGRSLAEFFQERLFDPLDMPDTSFYVDPSNHHRLAACYAPLSGAELGGGTATPPLTPKPTGYQLQDPASTSPYLEPTPVYSGGGGLTSSMRDYARFCQMVLNRGELDGERVLGRTTVEYMRRNQLPENRDMAAMGQPVWSETSYEGIGFGLGFAVVVDPVKAQVIASPGEHHWGGAASTFFWLDPKEDLYAVFLTQLMPSSTYPLRREFRVGVYQSLLD